MPVYTVYFVNTVSTSITVEADDDQDAIDKAYQSPKMPGSIGINAYGATSVDDGQWEPNSVSDENGVEVWTDGPAEAAS